MRSLRNSTRLSLENLENRLVPSSSPWGCPELTANLPVQNDAGTTDPVCVSIVDNQPVTIDATAELAQTDNVQPVAGSAMVDAIVSVPNQTQTDDGGTAAADQVWSKFNYNSDSATEIHASENSNVADQVWSDGGQTNDYMWA